MGDRECCQCRLRCRFIQEIGSNRRSDAMPGVEILRRMVYTVYCFKVMCLLFIGACCPKHPIKSNTASHRRREWDVGGSQSNKQEAPYGEDNNQERTCHFT